MCLTIKLSFNVRKIAPSDMFRLKVAWNTSHPRPQRFKWKETILTLQEAAVEETIETNV